MAHPHRPSFAAVTSGDLETANDRLKASLGSRLWSSMIAATVLHFALFALWPAMYVVDLAAASDELVHVELPKEFELPEKPDPIPAPLHPVIGGPEIDEDITIHDTTLDANPPADVPPPPREAAADRAGARAFTPYTVAPRLLNGAQVERSLASVYPGTLRDAGIGGTVTVHLYVDDDGVVREASVHQSSGYGALDRAALEVADVMRFSPALNLDAKVGVWVRQAITFTAREL